MLALLLSSSLLINDTTLLANDVDKVPVDPRTEAVVVKAAEVHVGDGQVYRPGAIVILEGQIAAVGTDPGLELEPTVIDLGDAVITPGMIDAGCQLGTHTVVGFAEQVSEVIPHLDVADAVDLHSRELETLAKEGVTTIYVSPEAASVVGTKGAVIKTGGGDHSRFLEAPPSIKTNIGPECVSRGGRNGTPRGNNITFMVRRPTTRMGSVFVLRMAFYEATKHRSGLATPHSDPEAMAALAEVLEGKTSVRFQARKAHDIHTAERLMSEFGIEHTLEGGQEAWRCLDLLKNNNTTVIYGPFDRAGNRAFGDGLKPCRSAVTQIHEAGIRYCLTAADMTGETGLARQAGHAVRHGITTEQALAAVTSTAAAVLGIEDQTGTLSKGRDADLIAWSGTPFADSSRVVFTMIDGEIAFDANGDRAETP